MAKLSTEDARRLLASVREDHGGFRAGLDPATSEQVLETLIALQSKFDRVVTCR